MLGLLGLWIAAARAAEVTDMAPGQGLSGGLSFRGSSLQGGLVEQGLLVSRRRISRDDLDVFAEVAPIPGAAITIDLQTTPSYTFKYPDSRTMVVEPTTGSGSYLSGQVVEDPVVLKAGGLDGAWIGIAAAPFSEKYDASQRATSRFDLALRTPSPGRNLWTANDAGKRGPSPGGTAIKLSAAFSSQRGVSSPWLHAQWIHESKLKVDVRDEAGHVWARNLELRPASTFTTDAGVEVTAAQDAETGSKYAIDLWMGVGYRSWEDVASGVYLPNVLDSGRAIAVTTSDTVLGRAGLAVDTIEQNLLRIRAGATFDYAMPYELEHIYDVTTSPNTVEVGGFIEVSGFGSWAKKEASE